MTDGHASAVALLIALWLLGACRAAPERFHDDPVFGPATGPLRLAAPEGDGPNLAELAREHARLCRFELVVDEAAARALEAEPLGLLRAVEVPAAEVSNFTQALLEAHGWIYAVGAESPVRVVSVHRAAESATVAARAIEPSDLPRYAEHRAVAIETVVPAPPGSYGVEFIRLLPPGGALVLEVLGPGEFVHLRGPATEVAQMAFVLAVARRSADSAR